MKRTPGFVLAALLIVGVAGAALWFALTGSATRGSAMASAFAAMASTLAALAAIYLSREALARTDKQLASARMATVLSRYPLLLPIHQSVTFPDSSGVIASHPPTDERFRLNSAQAGCYAFVEDIKDEFIIPIENVGEGPALGITGRLWRNDGTVGDIAGPATLATGRVAIMKARLQRASIDLPAGFRNKIQHAADGSHRTYFWLDLSYFDVFDNPRTARAVFDPRGMGAWDHIYEPTVKSGDRSAELTVEDGSPAHVPPNAGRNDGRRAGSSGRSAIQTLLLTHARKPAIFVVEGEKVDVQGVNKG